ncbi:MAG: gamma-glutamyl-phosphate reductase, partial [Pseudomonadota bacterium]
MLDKVNEIDVKAVMAEIGEKAKAASRPLATASSADKDTALGFMAEALWEDRAIILEANAKDMVAAEKSGMASAFLDRLKLDESRVQGMVDGLKAIVELNDPVGSVIDEWDRPNGLHIERVRTP